MIFFSKNSIYFRRNMSQLQSKWVKESLPTKLPENLNIEKIFINEKVQELFNKMTSLDLKNKIFAERRIPTRQRSHFALMTEEMYQNLWKKMEERGRTFLEVVPFKEPRPNSFTVLSSDPEIKYFDNSKFVFTDITYDATNQDRTVVVREPDGTLRTALPEEHDRMNRLYYEQPNRPVFEPALFSQPYLGDCLNRDQHEFVLDYGTFFFEPDDPRFVELCKETFDHVLENNKIDLLNSTRHFASLIFYSILNGKFSEFLNYFGNNKSLSNAANYIRLIQIILPPNEHQESISEETSDLKTIWIFLKSNKNLIEEIPQLVELVKSEKNSKKVP